MNPFDEVKKIGRHPCGIVVYPVSDDAPNGWGKPFEDIDGNPINPPLGTVGGSDPNVFIGNTGTPSRYLKRGYPQPQSGSCYWAGDIDILLSWHGPHSLHIRPHATITGSGNALTPSLKGYPTINPPIYIDAGENFRVVQHVRWVSALYAGGKQIGALPQLVSGACAIKSSVSDKKYLVAVGTNTAAMQDTIYYAELTSLPIEIVDWSIAGNIIYPNDANHQWLVRTDAFKFSASGKKAACCVDVASLAVPSSGGATVVNPIESHMHVGECRITLSADDSGVILDTQVFNVQENNYIVTSLNETRNWSFDADHVGSFNGASSGSVDSVSGTITQGIGFDGEIEKLFTEAISAAYVLTGSFSHTRTEDDPGPPIIIKYVFTLTSSRNKTFNMTYNFGAYSKSIEFVDDALTDQQDAEDTAVPPTGTRAQTRLGSASEGSARFRWLMMLLDQGYACNSIQLSGVNANFNEDIQANPEKSSSGSNSQDFESNIFDSAETQLRLENLSATQSGEVFDFIDLIATADDIANTSGSTNENFTFKEYYPQTALFVAFENLFTGAANAENELIGQIDSASSSNDFNDSYIDGETNMTIALSLTGANQKIAGPDSLDFITRI